MIQGLDNMSGNLFFNSYAIPLCMNKSNTTYDNKYHERYFRTFRKRTAFYFVLIISKNSDQISLLNGKQFRETKKIK